MIYAFKCKECGGQRDSSSRNPDLSCCDRPMVRDYSSVQLGGSAFTEHFNYATGEYVRNDREFRDALKRKADDNSRLTGVDHSYTPIYPSEMESIAPRTETEAVEKSRRGWHDKLGGAVNTGQVPV